MTIVSNTQFVDSLVQAGSLKTPSIIAAFQHIDRMHFVPAQYRNDAYKDYPLPLGHGGTISQPSTVAFMLEKLQSQAGDIVLDVGSGSGRTTALLGHIVGEQGKVYGVEIVPELVVMGQTNISKYELPWVSIKLTPSIARAGLAGNVMGLPARAPFDKILVSAAATHYPRDLEDQLKIGGRMLVPIGDSVWQIDKTAEGVKKKEFPGFVFVPLR